MNRFNLIQLPDRNYYNITQRSLSENSHEMLEYQLPRSLSSNDPKLNKSDTKKIIYKNIINSHQKQHSSDWTILRYSFINNVLSMGVSPCGIFVVFGTKDYIKILNIPQDLLEPYLETPQLASLYFSPNGEYLLCGYPKYLEILNFKQKTLNSMIPISSERSFKAIFTADGEFVAYPQKNSIVFWNFFTKSEEFWLNGHEDTVTSIECSQDSRFIISGSIDGSVILWNFESRRQEFKFMCKVQRIINVKISNNGMYAASIFGSTLTVWNLHKKIEEFSMKIKKNLRLSSFSPDNQKLAIYDEDYLKLVNIKSRLVEKIQTSDKNNKFHKSFGVNIAFTPDSKILIGDSIGLWKISKIPKQVIYINNIDYKVVNKALITNNGRYIGFASSSQSLNIFNMKEKRIEFNLSGNEEEIDLIEVSEDGLYLLTLDRKYLKVFNLKTSEIIFCVICIRRKFERFPISKDFVHVVVPTKCYRLSIWNIMENIKVFDIESRFIGYSTVSFSNDGRFIVVAPKYQAGIEVWNIYLRCKLYYYIPISNIQNIYFKDQNSIITDSYDKNSKRVTYFWNCILKTPTFSWYTLYQFDATIDLSIHDYESISFYEKYIITRNSNELNIWNIKGKFKELIVDCTSRPQKILYDGKCLSLFYDFHCDIWKIQDYIKMKCNHKYKLFVPINFSKNKKFAVSGYEKDLKLWDVEKEKEIFSFTAHKNWIRTLCFSHDSKNILSGDDDGCVKIWDLNGNQIQCFKGHSSWVIAAAFSNDDRFVVSGSNDRIVLLWEVGRSEELKAFEVFEQAIQLLSFTRSGKFIVIQPVEGDIKVLKV